MTATRIDALNAELRRLNDEYSALALAQMTSSSVEPLYRSMDRNWQEWEKVRDELHKLLAERNAEERERKEGRR